MQGRSFKLLTPVASRRSENTVGKMTVKILFSQGTAFLITTKFLANTHNKKKQCTSKHHLDVYWLWLLGELLEQRCRS